MTHYYALHTCGMPVNERNLRRIPQPRFEVVTHITFRVSQVFGVLAAAGGAAAAAASGQRDARSIATAVSKYGGYGCAAGAAVGPVFGLAYLRNCSHDSIYDRAYRLRLNKGQVRVDRLTLLGTALATGAAYHLGESLQMGATLGFVGGTVFSSVLGTVIGLF